jgi:alpha-D-xyloside xylohydrolase
MQPPRPALYIRWAQFGLLSSHARFHGVGVREPWHFGEEAVSVAREFGRLRYRLLPYIYSLAREAEATGLPVVRPLVLEYPDDPVAATVDYEYLLGPNLLVVPVMNEEGSCLVYLPPGAWTDWWSGERLEGPRHLRLEVPLERLPLYVRDDSLLAMAPPMDHTGQAEWRPLTIDVRLSGGRPAAAATKVWTPDSAVRLEAEAGGSDLRLRVDGPQWDYRVRFIEPAVREVELPAGATRSEEDGGVTVVEVSGARFELRAG